MPSDTTDPNAPEPQGFIEVISPQRAFENMKLHLDFKDEIGMNRAIRRARLFLEREYESTVKR